MAYLFGKEDFEGGSLPASFDSVAAAFGGYTPSIDSTSKLAGVNSLKHHVTAEAGGGALKALAGDQTELYIQFKVFLPSGTFFGVSGFTGFMSLRDNADADRLAFNLEDYGTRKLTVNGDYGYAALVDIPTNSVVKFEIRIKKSATVGRIEIWINNDVVGSPTYSSGDVNTAANAIRKILIGPTYAPEALAADWWIDDVIVDTAFIGAGAGTPAVDQEGFRFYNDDGDEDGSTAVAAQDTLITRARNVIARLRVLLNATNDPATAKYQIEYRKKYAAERWYKVLKELSAAAQTIPTLVGNGGGSGGAGAITVNYPTGVQEDDILLLFCQSENEDIAAPSGWTEVTSSPQGTGTAANAASTRLEIYWKRATPSSEPASVSVADTGDHTYGVMLAFRGCITTGVPINVQAGGVETPADTSLSATGFTTTINNCLVVIACAHDVDSAGQQFSSWANASLANVGEAFDAGTTTADGGGIGIATGEKATAGSVSATTATVVSSLKAFISLALSPKAVPAAKHILVGTPVRFTATANDINQDYAMGEGATVLVVSIVSEGAAAAALRQGGVPSYGGRVMTQADSTRGGATGYETSAELWYLLNPPAGLHTLCIPNSRPNNVFVQISCYKASDGYTSALDVATGGAATTGANPTLSLTTTVNGGVIVAVMGNGLATAPTARTGISLSETDDGAFSDSHQYKLANDAGAYTIGWTIATDDRCLVAAAFKCVAIVERIAMAPSSNIGSSGENTTARLTAPTGKTTGDFIAGRIQDDENPADTVDIGDGKYTEMEWSLTATDDA